MAIPTISPNQITAAMDEFDRSLRATGAWQGWEHLRNFKYAIEHNGKRYPVKQIVAMAAGIDNSAFITTEARRVLERKGFVITPIEQQTSPRHHHPDAERVYAAAEQIVDRVFLRDDSLFTPGKPLWTTANLNLLHHHFVEQPDQSKDSFIDKFQRQLSAAPPDIIQLAAELMYIHLLMASSGTIRGGTKRNLINTVLNWSPTPVAIPEDLNQALHQGLGTMGQAFNYHRPHYMAFILDVMRRWKALSFEQQTTLLDDPWAFKTWLFDIPIFSAYAQREAVLHTVNPDTFEAIFSRDHKQKIARAFHNYVTDPTDDVDRQLHQIRQQLQRDYGSNFTFYIPTIQAIWAKGGQAMGPHVSPLSGSLDHRLTSYIELAKRLIEDSYSAEDIVERLGQTKPPIVPGLTENPPTDDLIADLLLLRLIEPLPDGRYRRWEHLADGVSAHMLRYAAMTMLLPVEGQDELYELPFLRIPRDGGVHAESAWPGGPNLLAWYEEAGLVERNGDGWQMKSDALAPHTEQTPTAQAINTFLGHLNHVWASQASSPIIADEPLPILDPAVLDERIAEIQRELLIDRQTIQRIYRSLIAGKHVILSGPPGTGKTHLARLLPRILWRDESMVRLTMPARPEVPPTAEPEAVVQPRHGYDANVVTATEDWGVRHVIGGIVPQLHTNGGGRSLIYSVRHGHLTRSVLQNYSGYDGETVADNQPFQRTEINDGDQRYRGRWLIIDEFTRAPIDAAFGGLLTTLGGQSNPQLAVPTNAGDEALVPLPRDFRLIGTLNSFDRHFLNQISEAMKRRFVFIDILPPSPQHSATEQAMAIYNALSGLDRNGLNRITVNEAAGRVVWDELIEVRREAAPADHHLRVRYAVAAIDPSTPEATEALETLDAFWRLFRAIRVYRQLGTAQAEAVYATLFAGASIGMEWGEALDSALADVLGDQMQVLGKDEQRVLLALIEHTDPAAFAKTVKEIFAFLPPPRQAAHIGQLKAAGATGITDAASLSEDHLAKAFPVTEGVGLAPTGLFARRLSAFIAERGL